jgi:hypothetical protein
VFVGQIEERIRFAEAYERFPDLRGPQGPIHVKPACRAGPFPISDYEHIPGAMHRSKWEADLKTRDLNACARSRAAITYYRTRSYSPIKKETAFGRMGSTKSPNLQRSLLCQRSCCG